MSFSVNFNRHQDFEVNEKYVNQLLTNDKDTKVKLGFWDGFADLFRKEKKADVLNELYNVIHGGAEGDPLGSVSAFNRLRNYADPVHRDQFHYTFDKQVFPDTAKLINFMIGDTKIHSAPLREVLFNQTILADPAAFNEKVFYFCYNRGADFSAMHGHTAPTYPSTSTDVTGDLRDSCMKYWALHNDAPEIRELMNFLREIDFTKETTITTPLLTGAYEGVSLGHQTTTGLSIADELLDEFMSASDLQTEEMSTFIADLKTACTFFEEEEPYLDCWELVKINIPLEMRFEKYQEWKDPELKETVFAEAVGVNPMRTIHGLRGGHIW